MWRVVWGIEPRVLHMIGKKSTKLPLSIMFYFETGSIIYDKIYSHLFLLSNRPIKFLSFSFMFPASPRDLSYYEISILQLYSVFLLSAFKTNYLLHKISTYCFSIGYRIEEVLHLQREIYIWSGYTSMLVLLSNYMRL